jgi:hypothetical protein
MRFTDDVASQLFILKILDTRGTNNYCWCPMK